MCVFIVCMAVLSALPVVPAQNFWNGAEADVNLQFIYNSCDNSSDNYRKNSLIHSMMWSVQRLNFLDMLFPLKLGVKVHQTCTDLEFMDTVFNIYKNDQHYTLGIITSSIINDKLKKFSNLLGIPSKPVHSNLEYMVKASVSLLKHMNRDRDITVISTEETIIDGFYREARKMNLCLKEGFISWNNSSMTPNATIGETVVVFAAASAIEQLVPPAGRGSYESADTEDHENVIVVVPLDGNPPKDLPENTYVILPPHSHDISLTSPENILPSPLLFDVAHPLQEYILQTRQFLKTHCNDTIYKVNCLRSKLKLNRPATYLDDISLMNLYKIEPLKPLFSYQVFRFVGNISLGKANPYYTTYEMVGSYNIFGDNITWFGTDTFNETESGNRTDSICLDEFIINKINWKSELSQDNFNFKSESWIYAFLSLSLLGIILCIAILIFLLSTIIQRTTFEGNPVLSLLLLFVVVLLFTSVLPFSLEASQPMKDYLCTVKVLCATLSFTAAFSLILSRSILLSTVSKEMGFMSHIAGPVQSFLCLFIFGVQAALSLHVPGRCQEVFDTQGFVYLMSYNVVLLLLMLCLTPLIYKSERNYREGKYLTIVVLLISVSWCAWLSGYVALDRSWREFMVCFGLVSTGGLFLGCVFIPRTYLMTIAAERDKITSALPSLATATSAIDLYRAHAQPIYDCVNVPAINATFNRGGHNNVPANPLQHPDLYSCPALPDDLDFNMHCDSPNNNDKVTRF
ncbi:G protein coupled receptor bride of sevenless [Rhynchophorus ferrugineus]|uniref:G protein coupled receptor bride of sevenless n=1 Tax=Rhynchophorus ferrugineus TaxID=354439 RepID=UPI003FCE27AD